MIIGLDFDNTLVSYDALFHRIAQERQLIPADLPVNKTAVRDHLRLAGQEEIWTEMQGEVYGSRMSEAALFAGVANFIAACRENGVPLRIISHKTKTPYRGSPYDLHAAARGWLRQQGFFDPAGFGLAENEVFFELTKAEKLQRIAACGCTHFIDDLPEVLDDASFPSAVQRYLFTLSTDARSSPEWAGRGDWPSLQAQIFPDQSWAKTIRALTNSSAEAPLVPLAGGANNRVYRLGDSRLVKRYFSTAQDSRDRFASERAFYNYLGAVAASQTPQAIAWEEQTRTGVFSFESGTSVSQVTEAHMAAALDFLARLQAGRSRPEAQALPFAAEACFSIESHLATVTGRVGLLEKLPVEDEQDREAQHLIDDILRPVWQEISQQIETHYSVPERSRLLEPEERCISPSDFGFHNSLIQAQGRVVFLDFEYAGWDDPAKLVGDFFCQPEYPVPAGLFSSFVNRLAEILAFPDPTSFAERCQMLRPLYQLKWSCILLNEFTPIGRARREFSLGLDAAAARRGRQLTRARELINRIGLAV